MDQERKLACLRCQTSMEDLGLRTYDRLHAWGNDRYHVYRCRRCGKIELFDDNVEPQPESSGCVECGTLIGPDQEACPECGWTWRTGVMSVPPEPIKCGECGALIEHDQEACPECGWTWNTDEMAAEDEAITCIQCEALIGPDQEACPECGWTWKDIDTARL